MTRFFRHGVIFVALAICCLGSSIFAASTSPEADRAWQVILEQAAGPGTLFHDQAEAVAAAGNHLKKQEAALRDYVRQYPDDPRRYSARIRLAAVLSAKAGMLHQPEWRVEATKLIADIENDPQTPTPVKADAGFARISQDMADLAGHADDAARDGLLKSIRQFDSDYPGDRRTASLLTEVTTLYDSDPTHKKALLDEAFARATDPALKDRIGDDLRRLAQLHRPVEMRLQPWQGGAPIDLAARRGRVEVILFWASWSMPALHELAKLERISKDFAGRPVDFLTVSLDEDRKALAGTVETADLHWPVQCDFRGWKGEVVRSLGINALPTVWIVDRSGNLASLNSRSDATAELIEKALAPDLSMHP